MDVTVSLRIGLNCDTKILAVAVKCHKGSNCWGNNVLEREYMWQHFVISNLICISQLHLELISAHKSFNRLQIVLYKCYLRVLASHMHLCANT